MKMQDNPRRNEQGGIIIWVLIAVVLFAGLAMVLNQGGQGGTAALSREQAQLAATDIIGYGANIREAVKMLKANGCSDTQISFETVPNVQYASAYNPNAPADGSCHVFSPGAGGIRYIKLKPEYQTTDPNDYANAAYLGHIFFSGANTVKDVGTNLDDLVFFAAWLTKDLCMKINDVLGIDNPDDDAPLNNFDVRVVAAFVGGDYEVNNNNKIEGPGIDGKAAACIKETVACNSGPEPHKCYHYYQTLIAR